MVLKFSPSTAILLKNQIPKLAQLSWADENELDLASIKQLKGCRTELIQDCLNFIRKLDANNNKNEKNYAVATITGLVDDLKKYIASCESYPRIKDFLNFIPDDTSSIVGFTILATSFIAAAVYLPVALITVTITFWALIDLFFNNRTAAGRLQEKLFMAENELSTINEARNILENRGPLQSNVSSTSPTPGTSTEDDRAQTISLKSISTPFYGTLQPVNKENNPENSPSSSFPVRFTR